MPPKLNVSDFAFFMIQRHDGQYRTSKGEVGDIFRRDKVMFTAALGHLSEEEQKGIIKLYGISNVTRVKSGEQILVADVFKDFSGFNGES